MSAKEIPVYLFTGFLEAGKTKFIQESMEDPRVNNGDRTLILLCEEGVEEYDLSAFASRNVWIEPVENEEDLEPQMLQRMVDAHGCVRVSSFIGEDSPLNMYWLWLRLPYHTRVIILDD